jgi:phosphocarrier protein
LSALRREVEITNQRGLHARASAKFVNLASSLDANVEVEKDGNKVCGTSIMGLMMLGAAKGDSIVIHVSGMHAEDALEKLATLVEERFGADEQPGAPAAVWQAHLDERVAHGPSGQGRPAHGLLVHVEEPPLLVEHLPRAPVLIVDVPDVRLARQAEHRQELKETEIQQMHGAFEPGILTCRRAEWRITRCPST